MGSRMSALYYYRTCLSAEKNLIECLSINANTQISYNKGHNEMFENQYLDLQTKNGLNKYLTTVKWWYFRILSTNWLNISITPIYFLTKRSVAWKRKKTVLHKKHLCFNPLSNYHWLYFWIGNNLTIKSILLINYFCFLIQCRTKFWIVEIGKKVSWAKNKKNKK